MPLLLLSTSPYSSFLWNVLYRPCRLSYSDSFPPPPTPGARLGNSSFVCMFITQRDTLVACVCVFRCVYTVVKSLVKFSSTLVSPSLLFSFSNFLQIIFFVACDDARTFSATPIVYISTAYNNNRQRDNVRHRKKKVERYFYHYFVVLHPSGSYWDDAAVLFKKMAAPGPAQQKGAQLFGKETQEK